MFILPFDIFHVFKKEITFYFAYKSFNLYHYCSIQYFCAVFSGFSVFKKNRSQKFKSNHMQTSESLNNFTILFFRSLTSQLRNMQTACQMVICWLSLWWWRKRMRPVGLLVLSHHRHWTSMTMKTSPLSSVILQKHTTRVIAESGRSLLTGRLFI